MVKGSVYNGKHGVPTISPMGNELLTSPKDRFLADVCSSDKAELLFIHELGSPDSSLWSNRT